MLLKTVVITRTTLTVSKHPVSTNTLAWAAVSVVAWAAESVVAALEPAVPVLMGCQTINKTAKVNKEVSGQVEVELDQNRTYLDWAAEVATSVLAEEVTSHCPLCNKTKHTER